MRPLFCVAGVLAIFALAGLASGPAGATSDDETPTIKKVMSKLHKGKTAPLNVLKTALKGSSPNWEKVQKEAKIYAEYSAAMPKNEPPRGDKESYDKFAEAFASAGKSLEESAEKEQLKGSRALLKRSLARACPATRAIGRTNCRFFEAPKPMHLPLISQKAARFTESVIRGMTVEARKHGAINLAQGMPDFPAPREIKDAACRAIEDDINQYAITWGSKNLREAIAEHAGWHLGLDVDPETEITVTCGSTEAMLVSLLSLINPGDEVILTQPFYENYWPDCVLAGATPRFVPLRPPGWRL